MPVNRGGQEEFFHPGGFAIKSFIRGIRGIRGIRAIRGKKSSRIDFGPFARLCQLSHPAHHFLRFLFPDDGPGAADTAKMAAQRGKFRRRRIGRHRFPPGLKIKTADLFCGKVL